MKISAFLSLHMLYLFIMFMKEVENMYQTSTIKEKYVLLLKMIVPILVTQVAIYLISFFDILMSSRYGTVDLAGVSIGSSIWIPIYTGLSGILLAITPPIVSQLVGAKKEMDAKRQSSKAFMSRYCWRSLFLQDSSLALIGYLVR